MNKRANKTETAAIAIVCAAGCLAIEAIAYAFGWTKSLGEAVLNWIAYTAIVSTVVILLTKKKKDKTEQE